jgi:Na+/H+ antiporter NhaD/arsenite permease-like protein
MIFWIIVVIVLFMFANLYYKKIWPKQRGKILLRKAEKYLEDRDNKLK